MDQKEAFKKYLSEFPCPDKDSVEFDGAVLLSDEIQRLVVQVRLIDPFDPKNLKPASYELTVGDEWYVDGQRHKSGLGTDTSTISIGKSQMAILQTNEVINLPRFLIARWNLRVHWVYKGLLWVGAPQVDPGWVNRLPCPVYNLSNETVCLQVGDPFARIDFVRTTPYKRGISRDYDSRPPQKILLEDYEPDRISSGLVRDLDEHKKRVTRLVDDLRADLFKKQEDLEKSITASLGAKTKETTDKVEKEIRDVRALSNTGFSVMAVALGALITALAVLVSTGSFSKLTEFSAVELALSVVAIGLGVVSVWLWVGRYRPK